MNYPDMTLEELWAQREALTHLPTTNPTYRLHWRLVNLHIEKKHQQAIAAEATRRAGEIEQKIQEANRSV